MTLCETACSIYIMKKHTNFRLSDEILNLLNILSHKKGISTTNVVELSIRELADRESVTQSATELQPRFTSFAVTDEIPVPESLARANTLTDKLRSLYKGESIVLPSDRRASAFSLARHAGVRIRTRSQGDGTVRLWRLDGEIRGDIFGDGRDVFGQPLRHATPAPAPTPTPAPHAASANKKGIFD